MGLLNITLTFSSAWYLILFHGTTNYQILTLVINRRAKRITSSVVIQLPKSEHICQFALRQSTTTVAVKYQNQKFNLRCQLYKQSIIRLQIITSFAWCGFPLSSIANYSTVFNYQLPTTKY